MTVRLFATEFRRLASQKGAWAAVLAVAAIAAYDLYQIGPSGTVTVASLATVRLFGSFGGSGAQVYVFAAPVLAGLVAAGSLAADRNYGRPVLVLARGVSRFQYLLVKAVSMALAAGLATLIACVLTVVAASFFLPWGSSTPADPSFEADPLVGVFAGNAVLYDATAIFLLSLAAAALALSGLVVGAIAANTYAAAATPLVLGAGSALWGAPGLAVANPSSYLDLVVYSSWVPTSWWPLAAPAYWLLFGALCVAAGLAVFSSKEQY